MPNLLKVRRLGAVAVLLAATVPVAGCDAIGNLMFGERQEGAQPAEEGISNETAIVRWLEVLPSGQTVMLIERVRYAEAGDPHNVNRVVRASSGDALRDSVAALDLHPGDRVILSTQYRGVANVSGSNSVPDWPGHSAYEYPIGLHLVTAIARTGS